MKVAIDISPLTSGHYLKHRVRGTGFYLKNLKDSLLKYYPQNEYVFFRRGESLPKVDIVHYPYFEPFFITLPFLKSAKTVVTIHDLTPLVFKDKFPAGLKGRLRWEIQKKSLSRTDAIITDSFSSKRDIIKYVNFPEDGVRVVYLAASPHFKPVHDASKLTWIKTKFNLPERFLLYVGDVTWNKNLPGLIAAINRTPYHLVIVGKAFKTSDYDKSNPWNQDLVKAQELARKNKRIIPVGFVGDGDLTLLYNAATALIMPSIYEGFGLPILEAMQSGCPVITSKEGSIPEVAGDAPLYVDAYDSSSIKDGIVKLVRSKDLQEELAKKGIERAKLFSWEKTAQQTLRVYEEVVQKS